MSQAARIQAIHDQVDKPSSRQINWPSTGQRNKYPSEIFAEDVFTFQKMSQALPKPVYTRFLQQVEVSVIIQNYNLSLPSFSTLSLSLSLFP
jgi:glutamine synthetase